MLGLDLGLVGIAARGKFSPLDLFANGESGDFFDPNVLSSMTIGRDGTGGPPAVGDVVGTRTGLANGLVIAAPSDSARPILRLSNGRYYLETDGVDDAFTILTPNGLLAKDAKTLAIYFDPGSPIDNDGGFFSTRINHGGIDNTGNGYLFDSTSSSIRYGNNGFLFFTSASGVILPGTKQFISVRMGANTTNVVAYVDGSDISWTSNGSTSINNEIAGGYTGFYQQNIQFLKGNMYNELFISRVLTLNELDTLNNYLVNL